MRDPSSGSYLAPARVPYQQFLSPNEAFHAKSFPSRTNEHLWPLVVCPASVSDQSKPRPPCL